MGVKGVDIASFIQIQRIHLHSQFSLKVEMLVFSI